MNKKWLKNVEIVGNVYGFKKIKRNWYTSFFSKFYLKNCI